MLKYISFTMFYFALIFLIFFMVFSMAVGALGGVVVVGGGGEVLAPPLHPAEHFDLCRRSV
jgi:hypothetical protein